MHSIDLSLSLTHTQTLLCIWVASRLYGNLCFNLHFHKFFRYFVFGMFKNVLSWDMYKKYFSSQNLIKIKEINIDFK